MKIEKFKICELGGKTSTGNVYTKKNLKFKNIEYIGYLDFASAINKNLDFAIFMVENLEWEDGWLIGDVNLINTKKSHEYVDLINNFSIGFVSLYEENENDSGNGIFEIVSFVMYEIQ